MLFHEHREILAAGEHLVDQTVLQSLFRVEDLVAVDVLVDLLNTPVGVVRKGFFQPDTHAHDFGRLDLDVRSLAATLPAHGGLVDEDAGVREGQTLARRSTREQHGRSGCRLTETHGHDVRANVLHRVVDRGHGRERTTGRVAVSYTHLTLPTN